MFIFFFFFFFFKQKTAYEISSRDWSSDVCSSDLLQELKAPETGLPVKAIRDAGYGALWRGQKSWNGVAILAKGADPVVCRRELPGDPNDEQSRYLEAAVQG